jgi:glyoxylase-like metal-dependent hydrolase (beta-lactamase superfamily II)
LIMSRSYPREVAEGVFALGRWWGALAYLAVGTETLLFDTGVSRLAGTILNAVRATGVRPTSIDRIVLTHYDYDHSGSAAQLARELNAPVAIHAADAALLAKPSASPGLRRLLYHQPVPQVLRWEAPEIATTLEEGDTLGDWRVMHTPGHTPGSMSLVRGDVGIVGDALIFSRGRLHPNVRHLAIDFAAQEKSTKRLANAGLRVVLPGHYAPCTNPDAVDAFQRRLEV